MAFNNAGVEFSKPLHETGVEEWDDIAATNSRGVFLAIKYEIPHMLRTGRGVIVCMSSSGAEGACLGHAGYTASPPTVVPRRPCTIHRQVSSPDTLQLLLRANCC
ncbi:SDR family NAD(P)-dependent oxidoreductase [Candidatus Protofrankia californiensis]|uniref:SDR family NAD(P)-dependent oxidoreductase n=1 Tax=Candidatus Protofrankia californiensis TaxID=1839754 RepID=UPI0019D2CF56